MSILLLLLLLIIWKASFSIFSLMQLSLLSYEGQYEKLLLKALQRCDTFPSAQWSRTHAKKSFMALKQCVSLN